MKTKISAVIVAKNEEGKIEHTIKSLKWCDEIIVVDTGSIDGTGQVGLTAGADMVVNYKTSDMAAARNFGLEKTRNRWVLFVDADEFITPELRAEIRQQITVDQGPPGYLIRRVDVYGNKRLRYGEPGNTWLVRLGKKGAGIWERPIHEYWNITTPARLHAPLLHSPHKNLIEFKKTVKNYAQRDAEHRYRVNERWSVIDLLGKPTAKFIYNYFFRFGILDGLPGLLYAAMMSYHSLLVRVQLFKLMFLRRKMNGREGGILLMHSIIFLLLCAGQFSRGQITQSVAVYLFEVFIILTILLAFKQYGLKKILSVDQLSMKLFLVFFTIAGITLLAASFNRNWESMVGWLYWIRLGIYAAYGRVLYLMVERLLKPEFLLHLLAGLGLTLVFGGLAQYLLLPDTRFLRLYGWDDHYFRAIGLLYDPSYLGLMAVLNTLIWSLYKLPYWKYVSLLSILVMLLTYARSVYLVFMIGLLSLVLVGWKRKLILIFLPFLMTAILLLPRPGGEGVRLERTFSIEHRVESTINAWQLFLQRPLSGWGFGQYKTQLIEAKGAAVDPLIPVHTSGPDNSFMFVLVGTGVIGFLAFTGWIGSVVWFARKEFRIWLPLFLILIHSLTNNSFFYPWVMVWWWGLWAYKSVAIRNS